MITELIGLVLLFGAAIGLAILTGRYLNRVFREEKIRNGGPRLDVLASLERLIYRLGGIDPAQPMTWQQYAVALLTINGVWLVYAFGMLLVQADIPIWNQSGIPSMEWTLALNTAVSFVTSTNLQHYSGETGATYFTQMVVLTFLQFVSAGTSLAVGVAVVRSLQEQSSPYVGNFYRDFVRSITRVFLPLSLIGAVLLLFTGVPMTFERGAAQPYQVVKTLQGAAQTVTTGPAAAMLPIKHLGSNGGGFYGTNTAHPFENPNMLSYVINLLNVFLLPMAFIVFLGYFLNRRKLGIILFTIMTGCWLALTIPIMEQELRGKVAISQLGVDQSTAGAPTGSLEGKEMRFGTLASAFWCSVNVVIPAGTLVSMHDSYTPLSGIFMLLGMQLDTFYGGVGTGFLYLFLYIVIAIFIGSLMIGRTPELLGKKVGIPEIQVASLVIVGLPLLYLGATAIAVVIQNANHDIGWLSNGGYHGFTTILYEYVSSAAGNGSGFEGLGDNTPFWNLSTAVVMLFGRYIPIIGPLAIAGILFGKRYSPPTAGVLPTESWTFGLLLTAVIFIIGALCFFPALTIGPVAEYLTQ